MEECFKNETERLKNSWSKYDQATLRNYLVKDVQDPRINVQSILTRHWLIKQLFGEKFNDLMEHELRFSLVMNWLLKLIKDNVRTTQLQAVLYALVCGDNIAEEIVIPGYISETFKTLTMPNYICDALNLAEIDSSDGIIPKYLTSTFIRIWREILECESPEKVSVLEPACGSANDYRFLNACGIARFINYSGFDLCQKNIHNAKHMFGNVNFSVGNAIEIQDQDNAYDYCFVHDLFEHLSIEAMECAMSEICRVTQKGICINFFNMHDGKEHYIKSVRNYYWNKLSRNKMQTLLEKKASEMEIFRIDSFLCSRYGFSETHNKDAYTFNVRLKECLDYSI